VSEVADQHQEEDGDDEHGLGEVGVWFAIDDEFMKKVSRARLPSTKK